MSEMRFNLAEESFAMQASPSKARAEALESHSWSLVLDWLSTLYHPSPIPAFERNAFTLQALQSLMGENIAAERLRDLVHEAQVEELTTTEFGHEDTSAQNESSSTTTNDDPWALLSHVHSALSQPSRAALDGISNAAVLAGCSAGWSQNTILQDLQSHIANLPVQTFALETQLASIDDLISTLQEEIRRLPSAMSTNRSQSQSQSSSQTQTQRNESSKSTPGGGLVSRSLSSPPQTPTTMSTMTIPNVDGEAYDDDDDNDNDNDDRYQAALHAETVQHQRETKQLTLKCAEYTDRIAVLESASSTATAADEPTLADVAEKQVLIAQKRKQVEQLEKRILAFHNLPPDLDASRAEVQRAQVDLERLKSKRDDLFAQLGS
ncbi:hypothetical protein RBB50_007181 [Rhinocladiella similis]